MLVFSMSWLRNMKFRLCFLDPESASYLIPLKGFDISLRGPAAARFSSCQEVPFSKVTGSLGLYQAADLRCGSSCCVRADWFCENRNTIIWPPMGELEKTMPREPHSRKNVLEAPTSWQRWLRLHLANSILPLSQKVGEQLCKVSQRISCFHCILWGNQRPSILRGNSVFYFFIQGKKNPLWIVSYNYWSSSLESGVCLCDGCLGSPFSCPGPRWSQ